MRWIKAELDILTRYYGKMPASQLVEKHLPDRTVVAVHKKALKLGLKADRCKMTSMAKKRHWCDTNFFAGSVPDVCYWAGFIAADGSVSRKTNGLKIELACKDRPHVCKFRNVVEFSGPILIGHTCVIQMYGFPKLLDDLETRFSITPQKSMTLQPPRLSQEDDVRAFIRGFFDGDGSISRITKNNTWRASIICGSLDFLQWLSANVQSYLPGIKCAVYKDRNCHQLIFGGVRQSLRFLEWLYQDSTPETRLDRKYDLFIELKKHCGAIDAIPQASNYRGVGFDLSRQKWTSNLEYHGKKIYLGRFDHETEAAVAYNNKARELGLEDRCYAVP